MNKIYLSLLSVCAVLSANAQLTQANHAPVPSYTYAMYHCDSVNTNPGFSGANVLWDYSAIDTYTNLVTSFSNAASTNSAYPNTSVVVNSSQGTEYYYSSTLDSLMLHGANIAFGGMAVGLVYDTAITAAVYPMSLNTSASSPATGSIIISGLGAGGTFTGSSHVIADGSGTLILPGTTTATFTNVLRVVTSQTLFAHLDSISLGFPISLTAQATITLLNFDYYEIGTHHPRFNIQMINADVYVSFLGQTQNISQTTVLRDMSTGIAASTPTANFSLSANAACVSDIITLSNNSSGTPAPSYTWSSSDNSNVNFSPNNTVATPSISFSNAGTYTITLTASNSAGTGTSSRTVTVDDCTGINELKDENSDLRVYPNPSSTFVNFSSDSPNAATVELFDITGKLAGEIIFRNGNANLNVSEMNKGLYFYKVKTKNGNVLNVGKVVVNR